MKNLKIVQFAIFFIVAIGIVGTISAAAQFSSGVIAEASAALPSNVELYSALRLQYDSSGKESSLVDATVVRITAGSSPVDLPASPFYINLIESTGKYSTSASVVIDQALNAVKTPTGYRIPENSTATFSLSAKWNPQVLFPGNYYVTLPIMYVGSAYEAKYTLPLNQSTGITIVGERSPYITSVTPNPAKIQDTIVIKGQRFSAGNNTVTVTNSQGFTKSFLKDSANGTITFNPKNQNIPAGVYQLYVTNNNLGSLAGKSNDVYFVILNCEKNETLCIGDSSFWKDSDARYTSWFNVAIKATSTNLIVNGFDVLAWNTTGTSKVKAASTTMESKLIRNSNGTYTVPAGTTAYFTVSGYFGASSLSQGTYYASLASVSVSKPPVYSIYINAPENRTNTIEVQLNQPAIHIYGWDVASPVDTRSDSSLKVLQGSKIAISGKPENLSGMYGTDYTAAIFFDSILNGQCDGADFTQPDGKWSVTCNTTNQGTSNFYIEIYKNGQVYRSNIIVVTVLPSVTTGVSMTVDSTALSLQYGSDGKESQLIANFSIGVTAPTMNDITVYGPTVTAKDGTGRYQIQGANVFTPATSLSQTADKGYVIPAGQTARFKVTTFFNPQVMFAGSYYASISALPYREGSQDPSYLNAPTNQTSSVVIIGERSPYINSVTTPISPEKTMYIKGVRLNGAQVHIDGVSLSNVVITGPVDGSSLSFTLPNLTNGWHSLQVVNSLTGASNIIKFEVINTITTTPTQVQEPTISTKLVSATIAQADTMNGPTAQGLFKVDVTPIGGSVSIRAGGFKVNMYRKGETVPYASATAVIQKTGAVLQGNYFVVKEGVATRFVVVTYANTVGWPTDYYRAQIDAIDVNDKLVAVNYATSPILLGTITQQPTRQASSTLVATLESTGEDRAGTWGVFAPGVGNINRDPADWNFKAVVTLGTEKTIKSVNVKHGYGGEAWSTDNTSYYPLVVFHQGTQLNNEYGQAFPAYQAGTYEFKLYGQREHSTFIAGTLSVVFTDGSSLSSPISLPTSTVTAANVISALSSIQSVLGQISALLGN
jgi:hypothetical protein